MKFTSICIITDHVHILKDFYEEIFDTEASGTENYYVFTFGDVHISLYAKSQLDEDFPGFSGFVGSSNSFIELMVSDVDALYEEFKLRGIEIIKIPTTQIWGIRSFWIKDPDGNVINFYMKSNEK